MIDLHCHSYYSDGLLSPAELVARAQDAELTFLALTDHDTVDGLAELHAAAAGTALTIINGIEISVHWKKYDIHILGLGVDPSNQLLEKLIQQQKTLRIDRAQRIGEILKTVGIQDAYEKARALAGHERVGRPHFAAILVQEGKAPDIQGAFKRYLGRGKIAYVPSVWISLKKAVEGITVAGGQAVIAHPLKYKLTRTKLHELIKDFKMVGGCGLEVISGETTSADAQTLTLLCKKFDLLASSGSDYHGTGLSRVGLGRQMKLPEQCMPIWQMWNGV